MAILLETSGDGWDAICNCIMTIAPICKREAHYIWFRGALIPEFAGELAHLIADLELEDHFYWLGKDEDFVSKYSAVINVSDPTTKILNKLN